jgi:hypothetical protein
VVKTLAEILAGRQTSFGNNQQCDLLIMSNNNRVTHLLEVKTDRSSTSLLHRHRAVDVTRHRFCETASPDTRSSGAHSKDENGSKSPERSVGFL